MTRTYRETFDEGAGGWWGWWDNARSYRPLEQGPSSVTTRSPWWIDYNHAPPGAGYLHMLLCLNTKGAQGEAERDAGGPNRYTRGGFPTDLRNAALSLRLRGELLERGAKMVLLIQASVDGVVSGWLLTGQPIAVRQEWSTQTIRLLPDAAQWTPLGVRHDRGDMYGERPLERVLADVNVNIMFVMFPLDIEPMGPIAGDRDRLRPEKDYPVWRSRLPEGYIDIDEISVAFDDDPDETPD